MSLAQRSVRSSVYTLIGSGITTVVQLLRSILLARLIAPEIFGVYSFVSSLVIITSSLPNLGMASALLNRAPESEGEEPLCVHFTISLAFNIGWAIVVALIGALVLPPANHWILWVILATQFVDNLVVTNRTLLIRRVIFRRIAIVDTLSIILSTISALLLACKGFGIMGLVSTDVVAALVVLFGFLVIRPVWKPHLGWSPTIARYLLNFGYRTFLGGLIGQVLDYIDNLWTGQFLGETALGYYSRAYTFSSYPRKILAYPLSSVASGTYAELKSNPKQLSQAFFRVNAFLVRTGFLMAGLLALIAPEFIYLVIGRQWLPMLDTFRLMLLFTLLDPIRYTIGSLFIAVGKPEKVLWARLAQLGVLIVGMFIFGNLWGISGVAVAVNLMILTGIIIQLWQARMYVKFSLFRLFFAPTLALILGLGLARLAIEIPGILGSYWRTASVKIIVFTFIYATIAILLERKYIHIFIGMVAQLFPKQFSLTKKNTSN
jgi:O-antigen/teichoic acid export membrane protein